MNKNRAVTYSLLAHIRQKSTLVKGPLDIFVPLIKRALSKMNEDGIFSGKNINEIKAYTDKLYTIDFPYSVIRKILLQIAKDVNTEEQKKIILNNDDSFQIISYHFTEIEETINVHKTDIENLEKLFKEFCDTKDEQIEATSIFQFIDRNRQGLSKYFANRKDNNSTDYTLEAQFVEFFKKIPELYEKIKGIYLGSIISTYIEFKTEPIDSDIELLFDTNFLVALLDLNTPESYHTAKTLMKVCKNQGFKFTVLMDTIQEMRGLLEAKASKFNESFLIKKIYAEDIYNACDRKGLNQADLERIADNLETLISQEGISIIYHTEKYKNIARNSSVYKTFQKYRNSKAAALHDATATHYVRLKRGKRVSKFEKVNCWFVNNAISRDNEFYRKIEDNNVQPEQIKADDLLNVLWLSNPAVNQKLESNDVADIGLSSLISVTLTENLPKDIFNS
jgi:predicted nucleic acid-binding protein